MYSRTSNHSRVNAARQALFSQGRSIEAVPPTQAALEQHSRRAAYQAGHVWGRTLDTMQDLPSPADRGWQLSSSHKWVPTWKDLQRTYQVWIQASLSWSVQMHQSRPSMHRSVSMFRELLPGLNCYIHIHTRYNNIFCLYL